MATEAKAKENAQENMMINMNLENIVIQRMLYIIGKGKNIQL